MPVGVDSRCGAADKRKRKTETCQCRRDGTYHYGSARRVAWKWLSQTPSGCGRRCSDPARSSKAKVAGTRRHGLDWDVAADSVEATPRRPARRLVSGNDANIRKAAIAFRVIEPITDYKFIGDLE